MKITEAIITQTQEEGRITFDDGVIAYWACDFPYIFFRGTETWHEWPYDRFNPQKRTEHGLYMEFNSGPEPRLATEAEHEEIYTLINNWR